MKSKKSKRGSEIVFISQAYGSPKLKHPQYLTIHEEENEDDIKSQRLQVYEVDEVESCESDFDSSEVS